MKSKTGFYGSRNKMSNSRITVERCRLCFGESGCGRQRSSSEIKLLFILLLCIHNHSAAASQIFFMHSLQAVNMKIV